MTDARLRRGLGLLWMRRSSSLLSWLLGNEVPGGVVIAFLFFLHSRCVNLRLLLPIRSHSREIA